MDNLSKNVLSLQRIELSVDSHGVYSSLTRFQDLFNTLFSEKQVLLINKVMASQISFPDLDLMVKSHHKRPKLEELRLGGPGAGSNGAMPGHTSVARPLPLPSCGICSCIFSRLQGTEGGEGREGDKEESAFLSPESSPSHLLPFMLLRPGDP